MAWGEISSVLCRVSVGFGVKQLLFTFKVAVKFGMQGLLALSQNAAKAANLTWIQIPVHPEEIGNVRLVSS